jgi:hypothetical protein
MSDKGSDLDVFDGLAAKKSRPSVPAPPPSSHSRAVPPPPLGAKKTLLGLAAPVPPPPPSKAAVPPPSRASIPAPPAPPPPSRSMSAPPPPPSKAARAPSLPPPPPSGVKAPPLPPSPALADDDKTPVPGRATASNKAAPPPPPPAAAAPAPGKAGAVDIDWDDDDEATQIFDRGHEDASRSLLHSQPPPPLPAAGAPRAPLPAAGAPPSGPLPAPGMPPTSRAPTVLTRPATSRGPLPPPPVTSPVAAVAPPSIPDAAMVQTMMQPQGRSSLWTALIAVLVVGGAATAAYTFLMPKKGTIVVTVAGPGNKPVDAVEVWVDAKKVCATSPCRTPELAGGTHLVKVTAAGYTPTADQAVKVTPGDEAVHNVSLQRASDGTGLKVVAEGRGLKLTVDGKEIGPLPQELRELSVGDHKIRVDGSDRYEPFEKDVTVEADKMLNLEPKLKVKKGLATIKLGSNAEGAKVLLVTGNERRPLPTLPITVDIPTEKPYQIVAEKKGLQPFIQKIAFEDGAAEKTFVIEMAALGAGPLEPEPQDDPAPKGGGSKSTGAGKTGGGGGGKTAAASGESKLSINSIPISNVILDGRPLGSTPKSVPVTPGSHTVIFVHPEHGRKAKTVNVEAGKSASASVKFP